MKKILMLFSMFSMLGTAAFSQTPDLEAQYNADSSSVSVRSQEAPPAIPDYVQPACPGDGYIWEPGYWAWGADGYYWVAGVWVFPPAVGLL